jgi:HJR/Mrr/RecB family endonuclease
MKQFLNKLLSRKLLAVIVAGLAAWLGVMSGSEFESVLMTYLGAQGLTDAAGNFKKAEKEDTTGE